MLRKQLLTIAFFIGLVCVTNSAIAQTAPQTRQRSQLDGTVWGVVYDVPATRNVKVNRDVPFLSDSRGTLKMDVYAPPKMKTGEKRPAVVFINGIGDFGDGKVKDWEIYKTWARLIAANGFVGITMDADAERVPQSIQALFDTLEKNGAKHGIDAGKIGIYAASANVSQATEYLMRANAAKGVRAAVLYYGSTPSAETQLRADLPVLFVVAESDAPRMSAGLTALWQKVIETRAPWTLSFASRLPHAFDAFTDTDDARRVIEQTIGFWRVHLETPPRPSWKPSFAREVVAATYGNNAPRAAELLGKWVAGNPNDGDAFNQYGRTLVSLRRYEEAGAAYEKALALGVSHGGVYNGLGQTRMWQKRYAEAVEYLSKAVELGARNSQIYGQIGFAQLLLNRNEEAVKSYEKAFEAGIPPGATTRGTAYYNLASGYARLKQNDKALDALSKAIDEGFSNRATMEKDEDLAALRTDARFQQLLARLPKPAANQ